MPTSLGESVGRLARGFGLALALLSAACASRGLAQSVPDADVSLEIAYTADLLSGGGRGAGPYVDNLDVIFDAQKGRTKLHVYGLYNNGKDFSGRRFDRGYVASNIETGVKAVRLYEAWVEQSLANDKISVLAGLYDLNSEFDSLETSLLFINPAHGIGTDFSQSGANGPSIFPVTSLALRVQVKPSDRLSLRVAILDGVPGNPERPKRTAIRLGRDDGALIAAEADTRLGDWRIIAGYWRYTGRFDDLLASDQGGTPMTRRGNQGAYLRGEGKLRSNVQGFFRLGRANGRFNEVRDFASGGLTVAGPFTTRPDDTAGLALAWSSAAGRARTLQSRLGTPISKSEGSIEASYAFALTKWLSLQPNLQYFYQPGFARGASHWIGGLRVGAGWTF